VELPAVTIGGAALNPVIARLGIGSRPNCYAERRSWLFGGPEAPQRWLLNTRVSFSDGPANVWVTWMPGQVEQQPQYGRMAAEACVIFASFGLAAGLLLRRQAAPRQVLPVPPPTGLLD
jgi:hypothetical protein